MEEMLFGKDKVIFPDGLIPDDVIVYDEKEDRVVLLINPEIRANPSFWQKNPGFYDTKKKK